LAEVKNASVRDAKRLSFLRLGSAQAERESFIRYGRAVTVDQTLVRLAETSAYQEYIVDIDIAMKVGAS